MADDTALDPQPGTAAHPPQPPQPRTPAELWQLLRRPEGRALTARHVGEALVLAGLTDLAEVIAATNV